MSLLGTNFWTVYGRDLVIVEMDTNGNVDSPTATSSGKSLRVYGSKKPTEVGAKSDDLDHVSDLGDVASEAIKYKALAILYSRGDMLDLKAASAFERMYRLALRDLRKHYYKRGVEGSRLMGG